MPVTRYNFRTGVTALFEMATEEVRLVLPPHLEPIEVRHQRSVIAVTAFLFEESEVGPFTELMFSVVVPPVVAAWGKHAKAGFCPFLGATSSEESRKQRSERFHFPYLNEQIDAQFIESNGTLRVRALSGGKPVVDMSVTQHSWAASSHLVQGFMMNGAQRLKATLQISGEYTMHENERGSMKLYPHPLTQKLIEGDVSPYPFREHWFKNGTEVFHSLETI